MTFPKGFGSTEKCPKCGKYFWNGNIDRHIKKCKPIKSMFSWLFVKKDHHYNQRTYCEEKDD